MSKFSNIVKGTRALRPVKFSTMHGDEAECSVRPLNGLEESDALGAGRAHAVSHGIAAPTEKDRVYEIGVMANTLLLACVDSEDPKARYFASVNEILENLDTDRISYLYEAQQLWQDECSPREKSMTEAQWATKVGEIVASQESDDFLVSMPRSMQLSFVRFTIARLFSALAPKSESSSPSENEPKNSVPASSA